LPRLKIDEPALFIEIVKDAISCLEPNATFSVSFRNWDQYDYDERFLIEYLGLPNLLSSLGASTPEIALRNVLVRMRGRSDQTVEIFQTEIETEFAAIQARRSEMWTMVFPVNALPENLDGFGRRQFTVAGHQVIWRTWQSFWRERGQHIPENDWIRINSRTIWSQERSNLQDYSFLTIRTSAKDEGCALASTYSVAEMFVSLLSLSRVFGVSRMSDEEASLSHIQSPKGTFIFDSQNNFSRFDSRGDLPREVERLSNDTMRVFKSVYDRYKMATRSQLGTVVSESIVLYHRAVTDETFAFAFLKLWMGLEKMMLMKQGLKEEDVIRRVSTIFKLPYKVSRPLMDLLLKKRNALVHEGTVSQIHRTDVNYAKWLFETVLSVTLRQSQLRRTPRQAEIFLRLTGLTDAELKDYRKIAGYVRTWRTERPPKHPRPI